MNAIDLAEKPLATAEWTTPGYRGLSRVNAGLDVEFIADEVTRLISTRQVDPRLRWLSSISVRILPSEIIEDGTAPRVTVEGQRSRFRKALAERLLAAGWHETTTDVWALGAMPAGLINTGARRARSAMSRWELERLQQLAECMAG
jgi:hypothetical protein